MSASSLLPARHPAEKIRRANDEPTSSKLPADAPTRSPIPVLDSQLCAHNPHAGLQQATAQAAAPLLPASFSFRSA